MITSYLLQGLALGFGSGITPRPFLALVVACVTVLAQLPDGGAAAQSLAGTGVLAGHGSATSAIVVS